MNAKALSAPTLRSPGELATKLRILVSRGGAVPLSFAHELLEQIQLRDTQNVVMLPTLKLPARQDLKSATIQLIREIGRDMAVAEWIAETLKPGPGSREMAMAIVRMEEAEMWAERASHVWLKG